MACRSMFQKLSRNISDKFYTIKNKGLVNLIVWGLKWFILSIKYSNLEPANAWRTIWDFIGNKIRFNTASTI